MVRKQAWDETREGHLPTITSETLDMFLPRHNTVATDYWNLQESLKVAQRSTFLSQLIFCPKIRGQKLNSEGFFSQITVCYFMWSIRLSIHHYQSFLVMCQRLLLAAMEISPTLKATNSQNRQPKVGRACSVLITKLKKQNGRSKLTVPSNECRGVSPWGGGRL